MKFAVALALMLIGATARLAASPGLERLPARELLRRGEALMTSRPDSAAACFTIIGSRYSPDMSLEEKEMVIEALHRKWQIYYYNNFDYVLSFETLMNALDIMEENGIKAPAINHSLGVIYQTVSEENSDSLIATYAMQQYRQAFQDAYAMRDKEHIDLYASNLFNHAYLSGVLPSTQREWELYSQTASWGIRPEFELNRLRREALMAMSRGNYDESIGLLDRLIEESRKGDSSVRVKVIAMIYKVEALMGNNDFPAALALLLELQRIAETDSIQDLRLEVYASLAECYRRMGEEGLQHEYERRRLMLKDSLIGFQQASMLNEIKSDRDIRKVQSSLEEVDRKNRTQRAVILLTVAFLLILLVLVGVIIKRNRKLSASNRMLFRMNQENLKKIEEERLRKEEERLKKNEEGKREEKYRQSNIEESEKTEMMNRLLTVMEETEEYLSPDFTLDRLSELAGLKYKAVSQVINEKKQCNYNAFINGFRINEACRRISDTAKYGHLTLDAISRSVGFKSRSAFINAFKKNTGLTPSEYQKISKSQDKQ